MQKIRFFINKERKDSKILLQCINTMHVFWKKELNFLWLQKKFIVKISQNYHIFIFFLFSFSFSLFIDNRSDIFKSIFSQWNILIFCWYFVYVYIYSIDEFKSMIGTRRWGKISGSCMCSLNKRRKKKKKKGSHYKKFSRKEKSIIYNNENNLACK